MEELIQAVMEAADMLLQYLEAKAQVPEGLEQPLALHCERALCR